MSPTPFVYLSHPIDFADMNPIRTLIKRVAWDMQAEGLAAYIPSWAFKTPPGAVVGPAVSQINRAAVTACQALVAFLPSPGTTSFGVPMEIEQARSEGKPIYLVGNADQLGQSWSLQLDGPFTRYATEFGAAEIRQLQAMIRSAEKARTRPPASRAIYTRLEPGAVLPTRAYAGDAGFDMYTLRDTVIPAGGFADVPVGISVQLPDDVWAMVFGRSSTIRKLDLLVTPGVIDTGYRGPLFAGVRSLRNHDFTVAKGERIAQLIPFLNLAQNMHATPVDVLAPSDRGEAGFGSSGA